MRFRAPDPASEPIVAFPDPHLARRRRRLTRVGMLARPWATSLAKGESPPATGTSGTTGRTHSRDVVVRIAVDQLRERVDSGPPRLLVDEKIEALQAGGVEFHFNTRVGEDVTWDELKAWDAVFLGHGAGFGKRLRLDGEELDRVYSATEFLVRANLQAAELPDQMQAQPAAEGQRVVVVGGGDTSMDCVRTAVRLGAAEVTLLYRRSENEMQGRLEERQHAREEGVIFEYLATPVQLLGQQGRVSGVECVRMQLGEPDESGRRRPTPLAGSEVVIDADTVVVAVGYDVGREIYADSGIDVNDWGEVLVDEQGRTSRPGVFAGGDNVQGADLVVTALNGAHQAIPNINAWLVERKAERAVGMAAG